jgi:hypothetical protein
VVRARNGTVDNLTRLRAGLDLAMTSGKHKFMFVTKDAPAKAGIDPLAMLVDRVPDDNLKKVDVI